MADRPIQIEFLYWEPCPSHPGAWDRLQAILGRTGVKAEIQKIRINTERDAQQWNFCGSPTIRINGTDIDPQGAQGQRIGLNCRIYHAPDGRVTPLPPEELILQAIKRASG